MKLFPKVISQGYRNVKKLSQYLVEGEKPKFFQPRTILLVSKSKIEKELDRLEKDGETKKKESKESKETKKQSKIQ